MKTVKRSVVSRRERRMSSLAQDSFMSVKLFCMIL